MQQKTTEEEKKLTQNGLQTVSGQKAEEPNNFQSMFTEDYEFNLSDFALFMSVMKVREAYEDVRNRQFDMEMQNDTDGDDVRKRSRFYQGMIDTPILKSGKKTRYKHLPSTTIIFITQEDIFGKDLAMYTFSEQCEEVPELSLEDGTSKIFLNMASKNGRPELISLLQYMKYTTLDNEDIAVKDERILNLDRIVEEVKQSEEWEAVRMNILEIGIEKGSRDMLVKNVEAAMKNFGIDLQKACEGLGTSVEEYEKAKQQMVL